MPSSPNQNQEQWKINRCRHSFLLRTPGRAQHGVGDAVDVPDGYGFHLREVTAKVADHVSAFEIIGEAFQGSTSFTFRASAFFRYANFAEPAENLSLSRHAFFPDFPRIAKSGERSDSRLSTPESEHVEI